MKLELKYLVGYLPYGLNILTNSIIREMVCEISTMETGSKRTSITNILNGIGHKPILRPLSDLTKEIEVNGENFIPIEVINRDFNKEFHIFQEDDSEFYFDNITTSCNGNSNHTIDMIDTFEILQKLLEWHFDIYELIENDLAININSLV